MTNKNKISPMVPVWLRGKLVEVVYNVDNEYENDLEMTIVSIQGIPSKYLHPDYVMTARMEVRYVLEQIELEEACKDEDFVYEYPFPLN